MVQSVKRTPDNPNSASSNMKRPHWISAKASLIINGKNDASVWGEARIGNRRLAQLTWSPDGRLLYEKPFDADEKAHGIETERDDSGRVVWCARWVHGSMHGPVIQFDHRGRPIVVTYFVHGRGTDIWVNCGKVTEFREMQGGVPHGFVRWGDPRKPWEEGHFSHGQRHGIFREWESDGTLRAGFPHYYVKDILVSRGAYDVASSEDKSLPKYNVRDDFNRRAMPQAVREALARAKTLRRELALVEQVQSQQ